MIYVALLRGINVGGNNKVAMSQLKLVFEQLGFTDVKTYINSGNVIFRNESHEHVALADIIEAALLKDFGLNIKVVVRDNASIQAIAKALPTTWVNDQTMKCDVMFLWEHFDTATVLDGLVIKPELEDVKYVPGAIIWRVDRDNVTRSGIMKLVGTELYRHMTIRNCNTVRKLAIMMKEIQA